ncbi:hypothetical protein BKI52_42365 [marine bacterium AO1-C]|nr:hypothetical protein BKI52_42365 [marine bacterium AO1-C]
MVLFPPTLRIPYKDELPKDITILNRWKASKQANIVAGYQLTPVPINEDSNFKFYAQINVNNQQLWTLFIALANELPEDVTLVFGIQDNELQYRDFSSKTALLKSLIFYQKELTQDPYFQWGLLYQSNEGLTEVFITPFKYLQFWGNDQSVFQSIMKQHGLEEIPNIDFIDAYLKITFSLQSIDNSTLDSEELMEKLKHL